MHQRCVSAAVSVLGVWLLPIAADAQTATYHLHREVSKTAGLFQLKAAGPDAGDTTISSADAKNQPPGEYLVKAFDTPAGVPNAIGTIPAGSAASFTLWMNKSANVGTIYPRVKLHLNSAAGASLCSTTGATALTTTIASYSLTCTTSAHLSMNPADRFYLWVGVSVATAAGKTSVRGQLTIEGVLNGNYDSRIVVPLPVVAPAISSLSPASGAAGAPIAIAGFNFGSTQGASRVTFNGVDAVPSAWSPIGITAPVPAGATTGPVVVSVGGLASNGSPFTVVALGGITGRVTRADSGAPIAGATVVARAGSIGGTATADPAGAYGIANLPAGSYAVTAAADGYRSGFTSVVTVTDGASTTRDFALERGSVSYAYDDLDRLIAVIDSSGASAAYRYDAAGNVLSIVRQGVEASAILGFSPTRGPVDTEVAITGTAFSSTPGANTVVFNGSAAQVTAASYTQLVATVPAGATTGPITVVSPAGTAVSSLPFTVTSGTSAPTIAGFTPPIAARGAPVVITGSSFDTIPGATSVRQNVTFMAPASVSSGRIEAPVPFAATTGHISVTTLHGSAVSSSVLFVPPAPYTVNDVRFAALTTFGQWQTVTTGTGGVGLLAFDGVAGQRVAVRFEGNAQKSLLDPFGREIGSFSSTFLRVHTLPIDGTYTVVQHPCVYLCLVSYGAAVYEVPPDVTATVAIGGPPLTFDITALGQRARLLFPAAAGQHVGLTMTAGTPGCCLWSSFTSPSGGNVPQTSGYIGVGTPTDAALPETGTYTLLLDGGGGFNTGHFTVALRNIADVLVSVDVDGPAVTATTSEPDQDIRATFAGTAGERLALLFSDVTLHYWSRVSVRKPDGTTLVEHYLGTGADPYGSFIELGALPQSGTYTVLIDVEPYLTGGSVTLRVVTEPPDLITSIVVDGPPVTVSISQRGQNAIVTFSGIAGQRITVRLTNNTIVGSVMLYGPGSPDPTGVDVNPGGEYSFEATLPASGSYRLVIDPYAETTGAITVAITSS